MTAGEPARPAGQCTQGEVGELASCAAGQRWLVALALMSGAAGLAWQGLWVSQWGIALGHEWSAAIGITGALFVGCAVGAVLLGPRVERSSRPYHWYAALEAVVGLWGLAVCLLLPPSMPWLAGLVGQSPAEVVHAMWALGTPALALLPCTLAMGASLPALVQMDRSRAGQWAGGASHMPQPFLPRMYAANTAGAMIGVLLVVFLLVPRLGLSATAGLVGLLNLACVVLALRAAPPAPTKPPAGLADHGPEGSMPHSQDQRRALAVVAASGLAGIAYETLCVRVLSQVTENTVYSFAIVLSVYLLGTAAGSGLVIRRASLAPWKWLLISALSVALGCAALWGADRLGPALWPGRGSTLGLGAEAAAALAALLLPAAAMGAAFTASCRWAQASGVRLSHALALNTAAAALGPVLMGMLAVPTWGSGPSALALVGAYALLAVMACPISGWHLGAALGVVCLVTAALLASGVGPQSLQLVDLEPGDQLILHREGRAAAVSVVQDKQGVQRLHINNRAQEGSSAASPVETRLALLPMALHPQAQKVLFLGLGTGYTARVAALDPGLSIDAVELLPEVVAASEVFAQSPGFPQPVQGPRLITADARRFVLASPERYDLIVSDLFHPARSGAGSLYTVEHFRAMGERLAPGGLVCQWLALHQMELSTLKPIVAAFLQAFPGAAAVLASNSLDTPVLGLIARPSGAWPSSDLVRQRLQALGRTHAPWMDKARLADAATVLGSLLAGPVELARWTHDAAPNRDDHPLVNYAAPWDTYAPRTSARSRLSSLLTELGDLPAAAVAGLLPPGEDTGPVTAYIQARNRYLRLGLSVPAGTDPAKARKALEPALQLLLSSSPDFIPAIDALRALRQRPKPAPELPSPSNTR